MRRFPQNKVTNLNIGCGKLVLKGFTGVDIIDNGQDMVWDVRDGLPFPDYSLSKICSCHFVEHLTDDETIELFKDIYRVLKIRGSTFHRCPHQQHPTAYYCGHKSFWNKERIEALIRVPGLENFLIINNEGINGELMFELRKIK